ncbi:MAG: M81 family metallopeptidase [Gammaproteobacteria bacterium]|nr:M81 family metallopeptidase [Gammaproteobacteria bacterium]
MLTIARVRGVDCVVPVTAYAEPGGKIDDDAFDYICEPICGAVKQGCDAVLLDLHAAMATQSFGDGEANTSIGFGYDTGRSTAGFVKSEAL